MGRFQWTMYSKISRCERPLEQHVPIRLQIESSDLHRLRLSRSHFRKLRKLLLSNSSEISKEQHEDQFHAFLGHHQKALHQHSFEDLRRDPFEQSQWAFTVYDVPHDFEERLERLAFPLGRWPGLQADFCDDEWLSDDCRHGFRERSENWFPTGQRSNTLALFRLRHLRKAS